MNIAGPQVQDDLAVVLTVRVRIRRCQAKNLWTRDEPGEEWIVLGQVGLKRQDVSDE